jgi:CBS domain containing-hemolysin-like protein
VFKLLSIKGIETDRQTLSGFLSENLGSVPAAGDRIDLNGYAFEVTKANNRRAERVRVWQAPPKDAATDAPEA